MKTHRRRQLDARVVVCFNHRLVMVPVMIIMALAATAAGPSPSEPDRWDARLAALQPTRPMEYFELAEEMAEAATSRREHETARHLFALAGLLDRERLGASAALALSDLEEDETARRRLRALASLLATELNRPLPAHIAPPAGRTPWQPPTAIMLCDAFAYFRQGQGTRALTNLKRGSTRELLDNVVGPALPVGAPDTFEETLRQYRNRAPTLSRQSIVAFLQIERALLRGEDRSWTDELTLSRQRPLIEIDPERLEEAFGVDPHKPVHRSGRWVGIGEGE